MAKPSGPISLWGQYIGARLGAMALMMWDPRANMRSASLLGKTLHRFDHRHRERARQSIAMAFPEKSSTEIDQITKASFEHVAKLAVELMHTPRTISPNNWTDSLGVREIGPSIELLNARQPAIMISGHVGNWEVLGLILACLGYQLHAIARPLDNPLVNDWLLGIRENRGMEIITKWDATQRMQEVLDNGESLGFVADQNAGDKGLFVPFFNRLASCYKSIGLLALHRRIPIVCGCAHRLDDDMRFEVLAADVIRPEEWEGHPDPLFYITARYSHSLEKMIRAKPEQYLWAHRRWKSRPRFERQEKSMPESLRANLESLPWLTKQQVDEMSRPPYVATSLG